jgi:hypothetical protein
VGSSSWLGCSFGADARRTDTGVARCPRCAPFKNPAWLCLVPASVAPSQRLEARTATRVWGRGDTLFEGSLMGERTPRLPRSRLRSRLWARILSRSSASPQRMLRGGVRLSCRAVGPRHRLAAHPPASGRGRRDGHARRAAQPPVRAKQGKLLLISAGRLAVAQGQARRVRSGETSRNRHHGVSGARYLGSARRRRSGSVPKRRRRRPASGVVGCQLVRATTASRTSSTGSSLAKYAWAPAFKAELLGLETRIARQGAALRCLPPLHQDGTAASPTMRVFPCNGELMRSLSVLRSAYG